jgi:drug/metabolite transporter (DMT)-like permease
MSANTSPLSKHSPSIAVCSRSEDAHTEGMHLINKKMLVWITLCLIWGSTWMFIKIGVSVIPPITFAGIRFLIATIVLLAVVFLRKLPLPQSRADWTLLLITGILSFTLNYGLLFWGEARTTSGLAAILQTIIPVFGLLLAHYYLPNEQLTWAKVTGVLLGIAGVVIIFVTQLHGESPAAFAGSVAIVVGAFCVAWSNVIIKARGTHMHPAVLAAGQMGCGFVPLLIAGWTIEGNPFEFHWTGAAVISLFYLALVGSCCAFLLFYWLLRRVEVTKTMLISLVTPAIAVLLGLWWLQEQITWYIVAGGICIMAGILLTIRSRKRAIGILPNPVP